MDFDICVHIVGFKEHQIMFLILLKTLINTLLIHVLDFVIFVCLCMRTIVIDVGTFLLCTGIHVYNAY